jgi:acyl homoserine lactone synthase
MIALLPGESRALFPRLMEEMYDLRQSAVRAGLNRSSVAANRLAVVDYFDSLEPLYVLALDEAERLAGALRLLPTTGATMLNDALTTASLDGIRIASPLIWEASRLTLRGAGDSRDEQNGVDRTIGELGVAINDIAEAAALTHLIGVFDRAAHAMLSLCGCGGEAFAPPMTFDGVEMNFVVYEVGAAMDARFRPFAGEAARPAINLADVERRRFRGR